MTSCPTCGGSLRADSEEVPVGEPVGETAAAKVLAAEFASVSRYSIPASTPGACFEPLAVWLSGAVPSERHRQRNLLEMLWEADARHPSRTA